MGCGCNNGSLKNIDNSLIEAAENLGCSGIACFFKVVVPLIMPTLLAAALLVFMRSFADFGTPMLIGEGYRTFPVVLYTEFINEVGGSDGFAAAIAVIAIVVTTLVFLVQKYVSNKNAFALNSMHPVEEREARKGFDTQCNEVMQRQCFSRLTGAVSGKEDGRGTWEQLAKDSYSYEILNCGRECRVYVGGNYTIAGISLTCVTKGEFVCTESGNVL